jgi:hypothetical protein
MIPSGSSYGIRDVKTDDASKVYFYLSETGGNETVTLGTGGTDYTASYKRTDNHTDNSQMLEKVPVYNISLDPADTYTFPKAEFGYTAQGAKEVTVANTGNMPTGALTVKLNGTNAASFNIIGNNAAAGIAAGDEKTFKVAPNTGLNASTYNATVEVSGDNSISKKINVSFTVDQATPVIGDLNVTIPTNVTYNGSVQKNVSVSKKTTAIGDFMVKYKYNGSGTDPVDAKMYAVTASIAANANYKAVDLDLGNYTINRADPKLADLTYTLPSTPTYNGSAHPATVGKSNAGIGNLTVKYNGFMDEPVNVDTYTVTVEVTQSTNYNGIPLTLGQFEIVRADPVLADLNISQLSASAITYDGQPHPVTVTKANNGIGAITVKYNGGSAPKNVGTYPLTVDITPSANYNEVLALPLNSALLINKREITVTSGTVTAKTYNGSDAATVEKLTFDGVQTADGPFDLTADYTFGAATFFGADAGSGKDVTVNSIALANDAAINYNITNTWAATQAIR